MAILFNDATPDYYTRTGAVVTAAPLTMAAWVYIDDITRYNSCVSIGQVGVTSNYFDMGIAGAVAGDPAYIYLQQGGVGNVETNTTAGITANAWYHICGVFASSSSRTVYLSGGNSASSAGAYVPQSVDTTRIGMAARSGSVDPCSGRIAEVGIWNVALTAAEVVSLARGYSPRLVRPASLAHYVPLIRSAQVVVGSGTWSASGTPSVAPHAPVISPGRRRRVWAIAAAPAGRTTRNTRSFPLGMRQGMGWRMP